MLLAKCDNGDWVFNFTHSYHICRDKRLFTRVMACEHEWVTLPSGEKIVKEIIREMHLRMQHDLLRRLRGVRYIPKMMRNLISRRRLDKIGYTMKIQSDGVSKVTKGSLVHLKGVMGNNDHVLLRSGDLNHVESGARLKSQKKVTFVDGDYHNG